MPVTRKPAATSATRTPSEVNGFSVIAKPRAAATTPKRSANHHGNRVGCTNSAAYQIRSICRKIE